MRSLLKRLFDDATDPAPELAPVGLTVKRIPSGCPECDAENYCTAYPQKTLYAVEEYDEADYPFADVYSFDAGVAKILWKPEEASREESDAVTESYHELSDLPPAGEEAVAEGWEIVEREDYEDAHVWVHHPEDDGTIECKCLDCGYTEQRTPEGLFDDQ